MNLPTEQVFGVFALSVSRRILCHSRLQQTASIGGFSGGALILILNCFGVERPALLTQVSINVFSALIKTSSEPPFPPHATGLVQDQSQLATQDSTFVI